MPVWVFDLLREELGGGEQVCHHERHQEELKVNIHEESPVEKSNDA